MSAGGASDGLARAFYSALREVMRDPALGTQLRAAADGARLRPWTELLTEAAARACTHMGWASAAKVTGSRPLPIGRDEYLGIDVMAFEPGDGWRRPVAAIELENAGDVPRIAYSLWKACSVRAPLSVLVCYRRRPEDIPRLVAHFTKEVLEPIRPESEVLIIVGTRDAAGTFPDGYFRPFRWDAGHLELRWAAS